MTKENFAVSRLILDGGRGLETGRPVPWTLRGFYGLGQAAESVKNWGFGTLLLIYYNQVHGMSGTLTSLALALALAFDAFTDPAVGSWSDNLRSKYGRRHPFMLAAIFPLPICFFLLLWPPLGLSSWALFLWLATFTILTRTALTFFHVPYLALGAELTKDYHERTTIVMIRTGMGYLSMALVTIIAFQYFFASSEEVPQPLLTREPYFNFALVSSITMTVMMFLSIWGTRGTIRHLPGREGKRTRFSFIRVFNELKQALENHGFRAFIIGVFLLYIYLGVHGALATHLKTFYWELDTDAIQYWQLSSMFGGIFGLPLVPYVNRWLDKKRTIILGVSVSALFSTAPVLLKLVDAMPTNETILVPMLCAFSAFGSFSGVQALVTAGSMMADIADEHELNHGERQEGIYFSTFSLAAKCTSAGGTLIAGVALDIIQFPVNSKPGEIAEPILTRFGIVYGFVALIAIAALWVFLPYHLDKKRHDEIMAELRVRADAAAKDTPAEA